MSYYEVISNEYRFGRVYPHLIQKYMPKDIGQIVQYLTSELGMVLDGLYLENYKTPDVVVVMKGKLPMAAIKERFDNIQGIRFGEHVVVSDATFSSLEGSAL
jgi:hypothetical protein